MFEHASRGSGGHAVGHGTGAASPGKRTLTEALPAVPVSGDRDARGGAGGLEEDDRSTGALLGGGIGAVGGAIAGALLGGVPGAIGGAVLGGVVGAGIGAALGGGGGGGGGGDPAVPTPIAVRNGPTHTPIDEPDRIGMAIAITVTSSTGNDADMARIQDSEQVGTSMNHTGSATSMAPMRSSNSGFMPGYPIPADQHASPRARILDLADNHGGNGSYEREQLDIYTDAAAGVTTPVAIPSSGYIVKRIITKGPGTRVTFRVEKRPARVSVNGYTSDAGPSPTQGDTVIARA
jgi:hypothetical protein